MKRVFCIIFIIFLFAFFCEDKNIRNDEWGWKMPENGRNIPSLFWSSDELWTTVQYTNFEQVKVGGCMVTSKAIKRKRHHPPPTNNENKKIIMLFIRVISYYYDYHYNYYLRDVSHHSLWFWFRIKRSFERESMIRQGFELNATTDRDWLLLPVSVYG